MSDIIYEDVRHALKAWQGEPLTIEEVAHLVNDLYRRNFTPGELVAPLRRLADEGLIVVLQAETDRYAWART